MKTEATADQDIRQMVADVKGIVTDGQTKLDSKQAELANMQEDLLAKLDSQERQAIFPVGSDLERFSHDMNAKSLYEHVISKPTAKHDKNSERLRDIKKLSDEVHFMHRIWEACKSNKAPNTPDLFQHTKIWAEYGKALNSLGVEKASGDGWDTA